jgi:hypothetical protein
MQGKKAIAWHNLVVEINGFALNSSPTRCRKPLPHLF